MSTREISEVAEEMLESIKASPKHQRRLLSKTLWDRFGFRNRTRDRIDMVRRALTERGIVIAVPGSDGFGSELRDEWVVLSHVPADLPPIATQATVVGAPSHRPDPAWFELIRHRQFESEREVEYYFVSPLLEKLGYTEQDVAIGYPVQMYEGVNRVNKTADFVLFEGSRRDRESALLIVEAKKTTRQVTEDAVGQARAYAMWLNAPCYVVTNGDEVRVFLFRGAVYPDQLLMAFRRVDLSVHWDQLFQTICRVSTVKYKRKLMKLFDSKGLPGPA